AIFRRQGGANLLIVGQRDETITTMLAVTLIALAAQRPAGKAKFFLLHTGGPAAGDLLAEVAGSLPVTVVQPTDVAQVMSELAAELRARSEGTAPADAPPVFVIIHGLQKFKKLRHEDDFDFSGGSDSSPSPGAQLNALITEGSSHGIHLIVTFDTFNNIGRSLNRKALAEFEMRVVFQMSQRLREPHRFSAGGQPRAPSRALLQRARGLPGNLPPLRGTCPRMDRGSLRETRPHPVGLHRETSIHPDVIRSSSSRQKSA
ncbi:MAG: hypothetical protein WCH98_20790, partial [Verrucomicrobiota bacterium]